MVSIYLNTRTWLSRVLTNNRASFRCRENRSPNAIEVMGRSADTGVLEIFRRTPCVDEKSKM